MKIIGEFIFSLNMIDYMLMVFFCMVAWIFKGNKADCPDRQVKREDGERLAREYNVSFMETSAKTGLNVDLAFLAVAR